MVAFYIIVVIALIVLFFCGSWLFPILGKFILSLYDGVHDTMFPEDDDDNEEEQKKDE